MSDLRDLYQEVILDHYKTPRNHQKPDQANRAAHGYNPLCGDKINIYLELEDDVIKEVGFEGSGCAISTASASLMTEVLKGKTRKEAETLFSSFHNLVTAPDGTSNDDDALGKLAVLGNVREFPVRVKCATLAWHTLRAALNQKHDQVSTE